MDDLKKAIEAGAIQLHSTLAQVTMAASIRTAIPPDCYRVWKQRSELHVPLKSTLELLPMRDQAWGVVQSVSDVKNIVDRTSSMVRFCDQAMPFATARHLALAAYITTTWSVYDRLSNVCGRLIGHESIGNNPLPTSNPKLIEHFMRENKDRYKQHGFSLASLLPPAYGWPASVTYVLRNWLVNEGLQAEGIALFEGNAIADGFVLNQDAMQRIESLCNNDGFPHSNCCLAADVDHPWYDKSILTILAKCHSEVDEMFSGLLGWSVNTLSRQIAVFSERDKGVITASFSTTTTTTT